MKKFIIIFFVFLLGGFGHLKAQTTIPEPKLVVGIVIDQMRYDYLYRFDSLYSDKGLKRLMNEGSNFTFAHYN